MSAPADDLADATLAGPSVDDLRAALVGSACLGAWSHDVGDGRVTTSAAFAGLLGLPPNEALTDIPLDRVIAGIHPEDRLRVESVLYDAGEAASPFETEFRTRPGTRGTRWIRLMGRSERDATSGRARLRGLAFDLTEGRRPTGSPRQRLQRQANRLADHVTAMQGLVASLRNPPLSRLVDRMAVEIGYELARRLRAAEGGPRH